ncbi:hypothetical protein [Halovenus marina]|uniref:hypothetical protein n=1 Tax=Halovenus marina TaxID=3396621 RepID=UPI003F548CAC
MTLAETILNDPRLVSILGAVLLALVLALRDVGPRRAIALDRLRRALWRLLDPVVRRPPIGRRLLTDVSERRDEYIATVDVGLLALLRALWDAGLRWNPLSTVKFRTHPDGRRQYGLSVVYRDSAGAGWQQDVHIFPAADGDGYDVLGHYEPSVTDPDAHVGGDQQVSGDPHEIVADALQSAGIDIFED